jgi:hypothetical protein
MEALNIARFWLTLDPTPSPSHTVKTVPVGMKIGVDDCVGDTASGGTASVTAAASASTPMSGHQLQ